MTLGVKVKISVNQKILLIAGSGVGVIWMNYKHEKFSQINGVKYKTNLLDSPYMNKDRSAFEMVGLDGLPMMFLGIHYHLGQHK